ncbi:MAG: Amidohydrolase family protein [Candidatus Udaeobacter sp.]|nr:MAG: Amidohydrolase family protein [Candidatus Udaeobacter sp.]
MSAFERLLRDPSAITPGLEEIVPRFPPQIRRAMLSGALEIPPDKAGSLSRSVPGDVALTQGNSRRGCDDYPGPMRWRVTAPHELELYARAGIAPSEVLRMATLASALVMGVDKDRGVIAPGKLADMILVDGDPTQNIRDLDKITTVIKGGKVYDPAAIEKALGIAPRESTPQ